MMEIEKSLLQMSYLITAFKKQFFFLRVSTDNIDAWDPWHIKT